MITTNGKVHIEGAPEELQFVQVRDLNALIHFWPFVKKGIEHIKARDKSCGNWTHSAIFNAIRFGLPTAQPKTTAVELFLAVTTKGEPRGFMVTSPRLDPFMSNAPTGIHVWFLYADFDMITEFLPRLEMLGKINGGDQIRFESGRIGWLGKIGSLVVRMFKHGKMGKLGFRIHQIVYVKDIQW